MIDCISINIADCADDSEAETVGTGAVNGAGHAASGLMSLPYRDLLLFCDFITNIAPLTILLTRLNNADNSCVAGPWSLKICKSVFGKTAPPGPLELSAASNSQLQFPASYCGSSDLH